LCIDVTREPFLLDVLKLYSVVYVTFFIVRCVLIWTLKASKLKVVLLNLSVSGIYIQV